jgi:hypothetical protein
MINSLCLGFTDAGLTIRWPSFLSFLTLMCLDDELMKSFARSLVFFSQWTLRDQTEKSDLFGWNFRFCVGGSANLCTNWFLDRYDRNERINQTLELNADERMWWRAFRDDKSINYSLSMVLKFINRTLSKKDIDRLKYKYSLFFEKIIRLQTY